MVPPRWKRRQWRRRVSITVLCLDNAIITAFHHTLRLKLAPNEVTITGSPYPPSANGGSHYETLRLYLDENDDNDGDDDDDNHNDDDEDDDNDDDDDGGSNGVDGSNSDVRKSGCRGNDRGQTEPQ